jgi:hypothetical protein
MGLIKTALDEYARSTKKKFAHDRTQSVGASEIGQCARRVYYAKKSPELSRDDDYVEGWGAAMRGTIMENNFWEPALRKKFGHSLSLSGPRQKTLIDGALSATPDGLIIGVRPDILANLGVPDIREHGEEGGKSECCILVECKTIDPRVNLHKAKEENVFQVQVQLGLIRSLSPYQPTYALISYVDASFWDEVAEFPIRFNETLFDEAKLRAAKILSADGPKDLRPEGWIAGGAECEYCPFTRACGIDRVGRSGKEDVELDPQFVAEMTDLCRQAAALRSTVKRDEAAYRSAQESIKERLRDKNVRRIPDVVYWSAQKGRTSYDMPALREAAVAMGLDVEKFSTVGDPSDRLEIKIGG